VCLEFAPGGSRTSTGGWHRNPEQDMVAFTTALVATGGLSVGAQWEMSRKPREGGISQLLISLGPARNAERVY
jgi:hypothetical protein